MRKTDILNSFFLIIKILNRIKPTNNYSFYVAFCIIVLLFTSTHPVYATSAAVTHSKDSIETNLCLGLNNSLFPTNELLIKITDSAKGSIKKHPESEDTGIISINDLNKKHGVIAFEQVVRPSDKSKDHALFNWYKIKFNNPKKGYSADLIEFQQILASYESDPNIEIVEPDYKINAEIIPNDPYYSREGSWDQLYPDLWGIQKINSKYAWEFTTGSPSVVVADIDTGVDRNHEDLKDNMWFNTDEILGNGVDDDKNGYIDDYYGWDWVNNDNDPMDDHGHGTHTAGTIAAIGNNGIGVAGVSWNSRIMALKFLNSGGSGDLSNAVKALQYAADMGAQISSNSWGSTGNSALLEDAIRYAHSKDMVVVVAAGNSNLDALDFTPASSDFAITVAAADQNDAKAPFSNWGQKIDVAAPGVDILSTKASVSPMCTSSNIVGTNYFRASGTSMATPHVAGLAALIRAQNPTLTNEEVRQIIHTGADEIGTQEKDDYFGYGRINAYESLSISNSHILAPIITSPASRTVVYGKSLEIEGSIPGLEFEQYRIYAGEGRDPVQWTQVFTSATQVINGSLAIVNTTQLADGIYIFRLTALDTNDKAYDFQIHDVEVDNFDADIISPLTLVSQGSVDVVGSAQTKNGLPFSHYILEWGTGTVPATYTTAGITLINNGMQPVSSGKLATWDTSGLVPGQTYTLRLSVISDSGLTSQHLLQITLDKDLVKGWPKLINRSTSSTISEATPTIADLDNDGISEVVITSPDNRIYAFRMNGSNYPGFPVSVTSGEHFTWPANVADLDNDGHKEIVAASVTTSGTSKVYILKHDGTLYPGWPQPIHIIGQQAGDGTPTLADLNGDNTKDLIVIDPFNKKMHVYQLNGKEIAGFPKTLPFTDLEYPGAPLVADLNNDGKPEIAYGLKNKLYLFDNQGNVLQGWPFVAPAYNGNTINFRSSPSCGDIDGDSDLEILAIGHNGGVSSPVYAWNIDGSLLPKWPMTAGSMAYAHSPLNSPALTDVDGDGKDEAIVGLSTLSIFDLEGQKAIGTGIGAKIAPAASDLDGNGRLEFSGVKDNKVQIGKDDGSIFWERTFASDAHFLSPAVIYDADNNGRMEIAVVQSRLLDEEGGLLAYLWEMPQAGTLTENGWPMFLHDAQRSGRLVLSETSDVDTIIPTTSITSPASASTVSGSVLVSVDAFDNTAVSKVELYRDDVLINTKSTQPYTFSWDTTGEVNGQHKLYSKAYDAAENVGSSSEVTVNINNNIDTVNPMVTVTSPLNNDYVKRKATVTISADASDNIGVTKVEFLVNGAVQYTDTTASYTYSWKVPAKAGPYTLQARAYDAQGNVGMSNGVKLIAR